MQSVICQFMKENHLVIVLREAMLNHEHSFFWKNGVLIEPSETK